MSVVRVLTCVLNAAQSITSGTSVVLRGRYRARDHVTMPDQGFLSSRYGLDMREFILRQGAPRQSTEFFCTHFRNSKAVTARRSDGRKLQQ